MTVLTVCVVFYENAKICKYLLKSFFLYHYKFLTRAETELSTMFSSLGIQDKTQRHNYQTVLYLSLIKQSV